MIRSARPVLANETRLLLNRGRSGTWPNRPRLRERTRLDLKSVHRRSKPLVGPQRIDEGSATQVVGLGPPPLTLLGGEELNERLTIAEDVVPERGVPTARPVHSRAVKLLANSLCVRPATGRGVSEEEPKMVRR